jgi:hypothetical protein
VVLLEVRPTRGAGQSEIRAKRRGSVEKTVRSVRAPGGLGESRYLSEIAGTVLLILQIIVLYGLYLSFGRGRRPVVQVLTGFVFFL